MQSLTTVADSFCDLVAPGELPSGEGESYGFFAESSDIETLGKLKTNLMKNLS